MYIQGHELLSSCVGSLHASLPPFKSVFHVETRLPQAALLSPLVTGLYWSVHSTENPETVAGGRWGKREPGSVSALTPVHVVMSPECQLNVRRQGGCRWSEVIGAGPVPHEALSVAQKLTCVLETAG